MKLEFKSLRPGLFLEGVLARLDESTRNIILDELREADERLAGLEAATPTPLADTELAELPSQSDLLVVIEILDLYGSQMASTMVKRVSDALPGLLAGVAALEARQWVRVEDQLPPAVPGKDYSDWVLCANNPDLEPVPQMVAGFNHRTQEWVDYDGAALPIYHMTHWQPLPAAPAQMVKGDLQGE